MKAILVIEMPKTCLGCDVVGSVNCEGKKRTVGEIMKNDGRHKSCPLKPMPNDYPPYAKIRNQNLYTEEEFDAYEKGWNDCLEEITGETE